jgi:DNA gyrase subunit A
LKATPKFGKVTGINLVDETSGLMVISQLGKIIRIDTKSVRAAAAAPRASSSSILAPQDKVAAAVVIPNEPKIQPEKGPLLQ